MPSTALIQNDIVVFGAVEALLHLRAGTAAVLPDSRHLQHRRPDRRPEHQALQPDRARHPAAGGADPADPGGGHQGHPAAWPEAGADVPGRFGQHHARCRGGLPGDARDPSRHPGSAAVPTCWRCANGSTSTPPPSASLPWSMSVSVTCGWRR
ncbi:hypothetical protein G6F24_016324 [Rhizopus arrhizus]|nr:hypothetical protein G6F24_016324 [Rhizopus arrhizus]